MKLYTIYIMGSGWSRGFSNSLRKTPLIKSDVYFSSVFQRGEGVIFLGIFRKKVPDNFQNKQICIWEPFFKKCGKLFGENYWGIPMLSAILPSLLTGYTGSLVSAYKIRFCRWMKFTIIKIKIIVKVSNLHPMLCNSMHHPKSSGKNFAIVKILRSARVSASVHC